MALDVREYFEKYGPMVYRRCRFLLKNEEDAQDIMQDVFVQLLKKEAELVETGPSSLLYTMATNLSLNRLRRKKIEPGELTDETLANLAGKNRDEKLILSRILLDKVFAREQESTRLLAVFHWVDGMTLEETARLGGLSVSGVRKRLRSLQEKAQWLKVIENDE